MEPGDIIMDGGNEWYENTERRQAALKEKGIVEIGMGVSGGEEGARRGERLPVLSCRAVRAGCVGGLQLFFRAAGREADFRRELSAPRRAAGPAMMPGGDAEAYKYLQPIVEKVAAQTEDGACVTYIGPGGAGERPRPRCACAFRQLCPACAHIAPAPTHPNPTTRAPPPARVPQATTSRWCTTASSTATCSSSRRRTTCSRPWAG
jgi:hypothetical protein